MIKYVPNALTMLRVILVPFFVYFVFFREMTTWNSFWTMFIFVIASISDYYDGAIARKYQIVSNFGKIMDPLADKLLVMSALFALATDQYNLVSYFVVWIVLFREIAITILREIYTRKGIFIPANRWGKLKTVLQLTGIITCLVFDWWFRLIPQLHVIQKGFNIGSHIFFWIVALVTILSGISYLRPSKGEQK